MSLVGTVVVGAMLLIGVLNGLRRGAIKEGMALIGVLLGALLMILWSVRGGAFLSQRIRWQSGTSQWIAAMSLLWVTALLVGYGSGLLMPRRGRMPVFIRLGGAVLGLLNAGLLAGFSLRYTQLLFYGETSTAPKTTWIRNAIASRFLVDRLDELVLGIAGVVAAVALVMALIRLIWRFVRPRPAVPAPAPQSVIEPAPSSQVPGVLPSGQTGIPPGMEPSLLQKSSSGGPK